MLQWKRSENLIDCSLKVPKDMVKIENRSDVKFASIIFVGKDWYGIIEV
jgi:hypothetical protein